MKEENKRKRKGSRKLEGNETGPTYRDAKVGKKTYEKTIFGVNINTN